MDNNSNMEDSPPGSTSISTSTPPIPTPSPLVSIKREEQESEQNTQLQLPLASTETDDNSNSSNSNSTNSNNKTLETGSTIMIINDGDTSSTLENTKNNNSVDMNDNNNNNNSDNSNENDNEKMSHPAKKQRLFVAPKGRPTIRICNSAPSCCSEDESIQFIIGVDTVSYFPSDTIIDPDIIDKIKTILSNEFDLEINNKQREVRSIDERIKEAELMLERLSRCTSVRKGNNPIQYSYIYVQEYSLK